MIDIHPQPAFAIDADQTSRFLEIVCPSCHIVSRPIPVDDQVEQRSFDDTHRRCYINAVPNGRA